MEQREILGFLSRNMRQKLEKADLNLSGLQEIRIRCKKPLILVIDGKEIWLDQNGRVTREKKQAYCPEIEDIREVLEYISDYSVYAYEEEISQGFLTLRGGHRVGLAGRVVSEKGHIKGMKYITNLNIRIANQKKGCGDKILPWLYEKRELCHTLLISGPGCGKTTLLRDLVRLISDGVGSTGGCTVGVVDERSEIAACYNGIPQNDVGMRTDVLDCCPKAEGMMLLIRSMAPEVLAVDEISSLADIEAMHMAMHCGCKILATIHGTSLEEIQKKPLFEQMVREKVFKRYVVLCGRDRIGQVAGIYDESGNCLYGLCR